MNHGDSRSLLTTVYDPDTGEPMATGRAPRPPWVDELMNERDDLREENDRLREALEAIAATEAAMVPGRKWVHWRTQAEEALS